MHTRSTTSLLKKELHVAQSSMNLKTHAQKALGRIQAILSTRQADSNIARLIHLTRQTCGMNASNFLPWNSDFDAGGTGYVHRITPEHLEDRALVWGLDPRDRIFIVFQYVIQKKGAREVSSERASMIIFSRTPSDTLRLFNMKKPLMLDPTDHVRFFSTLHQLFHGRRIEQRSVISSTIYCFSLPSRYEIHTVPTIN